jgi:hypothetical protein
MALYPMFPPSPRAKMEGEDARANPTSFAVTGIESQREYRE